MWDEISTKVLCFSFLTDQLRWRHVLALKIISDGGRKILFPENADMFPDISINGMTRTYAIDLLVK